jgi:hypothetical protein
MSKGAWRFTRMIHAGRARSPLPAANWQEPPKLPDLGAQGTARPTLQFVAVAKGA